MPGVSYADLDTKTEKEGLAATVEGSDISNEDQKSVSPGFMDCMMALSGRLA